MKIDWGALLREAEHFRFAHPWVFGLVLLLPLWAWWLGRKPRRPGAAVSSTLQIAGLEMASSGLRSATRRFLMLAPVCLLTALAQPQFQHAEVEQKSKSIDIMLTLDLSGSMQQPLEQTSFGVVKKADALKKIVGDFIDKRPDDRIGCIGFFGKTMLLSPLTLDHEFVKGIIRLSQFNGRGTAIGDGILASVVHMEELQDRRRVIIVVTDGQNNLGISPYVAARIAHDKNIRLYGIELTGEKIPPEEYSTRELARAMAAGGGHYENAADSSALQNIYHDIDTLERTEIVEKRTTFYQELFPWPLGAGLALLLLQILLQQTAFLRIP